jgi:hypothetical protein
LKLLPERGRPVRTVACDRTQDCRYGRSQK